jgi:O-antigen/teichoic acid export membrane protein
MLNPLKQRAYSLLRWSEKYTRADMVYLAGGQFWLVFGRIIGVGSGLVLTYVFANFLDPAIFGTYKYILALAGFIGAFTLGGLGGAIMRAVAKGQADVLPSIARTNMYWSIPASIAAAAVSLYYFFHGNTILGFGIMLIAVTTPPANWVGLYKNVMIGKKDFKNLALSSFRSLIPVLGLIAAVLLSGNIYIILVTYFLLNLVISWSMHIWTLRQYGIDGTRATPADVAEAKRYGMHLSVMGIMSQASDSLDQLLLWHVAGPVQLATYAFALAPIRELRNFSQNVYPIIFPKFVTKTVEQMKATAPLRIRQLALVSLLLSIAYILAAPLLFRILLPRYMDAVLLSQILAAGLVFQARIIVDTMLYAYGDARLRYIAIAGSQGMKIALWLILIPWYGVEGAVAGAVIADGLSCLVFWWAYRNLGATSPRTV